QEAASEQPDQEQEAASEQPDQEQEAASEQSVQEQEAVSEQPVQEQEAASRQTVQETVPGQVDVEIGTALILESPVTFSVELKDDRDYDKTGEITIKEHVQESRQSFTELAEGEYTLTVTAEGFAAYSQTIEVKEDRAYTVKLRTDFVGGYQYASGVMHPGVLLIGDVNGDGRINDADRTVLVDAVDSGAARRQDNLVTDLNGDGAVNLVDLEYFAKGYNETRDSQAGIESRISGVKASAGTNTVVVEGSLPRMLEQGESVILNVQDSQKNPVEITKDTPVSVDFDIPVSKDAAETNGMNGMIIETGGNNPIKEATITLTVTDEDGQDYDIRIPVHDDGIQYLLLDSDDVRVERDGNGNILLHLGAQVAVKKVTLTITGMKNNNNLVEISRVEFVNDMEERIPEPAIDIPGNLKAVAGNKSIRLSWDACVNITGYEVKISQGGSSETVMAANNSLNIATFGGKELKNYAEYSICVQSVNGIWQSGYCEEVVAVPKPGGRPDKPDNVSAVGDYLSIKVSWKKMDDTESYNLYYKESGAGEYQKVEGITGNGYTISGLKELTEYTVYVTGINEYGESGKSLSAAAKTLDNNPAVMPKYNLINIGEKGEVGAHIISATTGETMKSSPLDTAAGTAWGTVDHDPESYLYEATWDTGGYNPLNADKGVIYEFDQAYLMDTIAFHDQTSRDTGYYYTRVRYWDENGTQQDLGQFLLQRKTDADGRSYYVIKLPQAVNAKKIQFGIGRYSASGTVTIAEVYFYYYDTLMDEIVALYEDDLHTVLKPEVTQASIDALRVRINTMDEVSGEYHPDRDLLERELQTAEAILNDGSLNAPVVVHGGITTNDVSRGFSGLNAWQPLGVTAAAQEEIMVYVGHGSKKTGEAAELQLVATQYHAEAAGVAKVVATLKVGANKITVPKLGSTTGMESGGALYIQYTGQSQSDDYAVRVSGGAQAPILDLYQVTDDSERLARAKTYIEELESYVSGMEALHGELHGNSDNSQVRYAYSETDCILGASDILLDTMMLSLPAKQILGGAGSGSVEQKAQKFLNSMDAVEDMMYLFYQHKGLNSNAPEALNQIPKGHLNIRYQRMFSGAFMYASGNHIGIEWGSAPGMISAVPVVADGEGRYQSGSYFGWGIAHEIGHCINQGAYAIAEITNNYYAVLAQAKDTNGSVRFQYKDVYQKVTSGTKGMASNVFTQLGMYWQLHLAYDKGYNYKTYDDYETQLDSLFFARVDTYARNAAAAPKPGDIALTLAGNRDQDLMRLSCAAAEKNILEFFERWGMTPDEATRKYAGQFPEETRAIYYVNDDARVYSLQGSGSSLNSTVNAVGSGTTAAVNFGRPNQVDITLSSQEIPKEDVLGYEITRCMTSGGETVREIVGFATGNSFSDTVSANNRVVWYEITVIDKYLNRSAVKTLEPIKIGDDGSLDKTFWIVSTQNLAVQQEQGTGTDGSPCEPEAENPADRMIDNDTNTVYTASVDGDVEITMEFNRTLTVTALKYTAVEGLSGSNYVVQARVDGSWVQTAEGSFGAASGKIYFSNEAQEYVSTYEADAVKLILKGAKGSQVSVAELDVLGATGDNVDFRRAADGTVVIGRLAADYQYGKGKDDLIPAGSIVFGGSYKGNPAYNVLILYDQDGNIVGGTNASGELMSQQILLAEVPAEGDIQNVWDGTWLYWIEPEQQTDLAGISKVRAELYRVNDALTNAGQRLVSDSLFEMMPKELPDIELSK
ncbi:MAG: fibronectin type III domain-containing protein, partial [Blautia sp.]|nr:fibronectin type III domain-containing protein [Blautia sp.]